MSIDAIEAVLTRSRARGADRLVLLTVAWHLNHEHPERSAWPSIGRIAEMANLSVRQVKASLRRLEGCGELKVARNTGPHGVNRYRLGDVLTRGTEETADGASGEDTSPEGNNARANTGDGALLNSASGEICSPEGNGTKPSAQNARNDVLPNFPSGEICARGVKSVHVALGEDTSPKPVNRKRNGIEPEGKAQEINGVFPAPGAGAAVPPLAPLPPAKALPFENDEKQNDTTPKGETTMTERPCTEGERPKSWAEALRVLLEATGIPEKDYLRSGKVATVARRWVDGEISEAEARKLAAEIARREAA